ncbi:hypothetical protein LY78DRAFT_159073 [Colletotrichum sublineola]|nr:hypothetical protein LY78DRAFT_159073 [Colletotrichum sublineola]
MTLKIHICTSSVSSNQLCSLVRFPSVLSHRPALRNMLAPLPPPRNFVSSSSNVGSSRPGDVMRDKRARFQPVTHSIQSLTRCAAPSTHFANGAHNIKTLFFLEHRDAYTRALFTCFDTHHWTMCR